MSLLSLITDHFDYFYLHAILSLLFKCHICSPYHFAHRPLYLLCTYATFIIFTHVPVLFICHFCSYFLCLVIPFTLMQLLFIYTCICSHVMLTFSCHFCSCFLMCYNLFTCFFAPICLYTTLFTFALAVKHLFKSHCCSHLLKSQFCLHVTYYIWSAFQKAYSIILV